MNTSVTPTQSLPGYQIVEQLYQGTRTLVYRGIRQADHQAVILKLLNHAYPSARELLQFRNQYTIAKNLSIPGIIHHYDLEAYGNSYVLVMEDFGGVSLQQYLKEQTLSFPEVLAIAIQLSQILHDLCQHQIIHKDIKPANILIHPDSKQIKLIDLSIASLLPKETQKIQNPNVLEGTLAYLAPEQTGRMNRGIDYRTDYYALGATLYYLLTHCLPFAATDPLELVHCHIAKIPEPVHQVNPEVPPIVSAIVAKLMAKNAEERYQSALGLKHDLEQCLIQWKETGAIADFPLAQRDLSDRFLIPEKLYGREAEVETLFHAFDRVSQGTSELILVAGFSGIGKTAVVNEVHKPIVQQRGYFIKGKFDQLNRNIPFSVFVQAFRDLIGQLLSESDQQLQVWKTKILSAVGENGQVIIDVIPELERIIGTQPAIAPLSGSAAQNRFNFLFQKFIQVFTAPEHPLVIFMDDLQWADSASLNLIELLMASGTGHLLLIAAYRDNEVFAAHPTMLTLDAIVKTGGAMQRITLPPLNSESLNQLIADTLHATPAVAQPLTNLVAQKTQGNPFFTTQFLKALYQDGLITFDRQTRHWQCDISGVQSAALTDDVVEFMAQRLYKLPAETQEILKLAACIGNQFDLNTLAIVSEQSQMDAANALWSALQDGLIIPISETYKFFQVGEEETAHSAVAVSYKFLHDRVQQAAYSLIEADQKHTTHLKIGQLLLQNSSETAREERIFEIVNQLNVGMPLIQAQAQRHELAQLNLVAGRKAKTASAYAASFEYLTTGIKLLATDSWSESYDLTLALYEAAAESAYLSNNFASMEQRIEAVLQHTSSLLDQVNVYEVKIQGYGAQNQLNKALDTALTLLKALGITFPETSNPSNLQAALAETRTLWSDKQPRSLIDLPTMEQAEARAAMQILSSVIPIAYQVSPEMFILGVLKQVNLSIQFGNTDLSAHAYACYGSILCSMVGDIEMGFEFGQLSLSLLEKIHAKELTAKSLYVVNALVNHWKAFTGSTLKPLLDAYANALESGDLSHAAWAVYMYGYHSYFSGKELSDLEQQMAGYSKHLGQIHQDSLMQMNDICRQAALNLMGAVQNPVELRGDAYDEQVLMPLHQAANNHTLMCKYYIQRLMLCYLFDDKSTALKMADLAEPYLGAVVGYLDIPIFHFYDALIRLALFDKAIETEQAAILQRVEANQEKMKHWADHAPMNYLHKFELVAAEYQRVLGNDVAAIDLYERAIAGAKANGYIQEEALANELAAHFYLAWDKEKVAAGYLQEAYYCYARWGAKAKTDTLEISYPNLLRPILQQAVQSTAVLETLLTITTPAYSIHTPASKSASSSSLNATLDFASLLQTSQAFSSTIDLDQLLQTLTQTMLEISGADKCILLLCQSEQWQVRVIADLDQTILQTAPLENHPTVPVKLIQYVKNTLTALIINSLETDLPVVGDYLQKQQPQSLLCLPILHQGKLTSIVYLENRSVPEVFTSDRLLVLNFLSTQAAISLANAQLYQQSREQSQYLQSLYDGVEHLIFVVDVLENKEVRWLGWNAATEGATGMKSADISGKSPEEIFGEVEGKAVRQKMLACLQAGAATTYEECLTFDDQPTWWLTTLNPLRDESDRIYRIIGTTMSITNLKRTETALRQSETQLQQKANDLEQAMLNLQDAQLQMVQNEKMASLGNLVAGVAHEINNPIGFLNGSINNGRESLGDLLEHLELYQQHYPNSVPAIQDHAEDIDLEYLREDLPKLFDSMRCATDRIKGISTSLRTFSRADTEHKVSANLHDGLDSTLLILKYRLKANEYRPAIQVVQEYGTLPEINCFPGQLNQVFMNILANAIDMFDEVTQTQSYQELVANPQQITLRTVADSSQVKIYIRDNGLGMSAAVQAKIFDHLFTTKGVGKGTGLGLAIARQIVVETHGGSLEVQSEVGQGTEFCICLPLRG